MSVETLETVNVEDAILNDDATTADAAEAPTEDAAGVEPEVVTFNGGIVDFSPIGVENDKTSLAKEVDRIIEVAERGWNGAVVFRDRLLAGEYSYDLLLRQMAHKGKDYKRSDTIKAIEGLIFNRCSLAKDTIQVTKWIAAYKAICLYTGMSRLDDITDETLTRFSYETLRAVIPMIERDNSESYCVAEGSVDFFHATMDAHAKGSPKRLYGNALRNAVKRHIEERDAMAEAAKRSVMDPDKLAELDRQAENAERKRKRNARERAAAALEKELRAQNYKSPEDIHGALVDLGLIKGSRAMDSAQMDFDALATNIKTDAVKLLVSALAKRNRTDIFQALVREIAAVNNLAKAAQAKMEAAAEREGATLRRVG